MEIDTDARTNIISERTYIGKFSHKQLQRAEVKYSEFTMEVLHPSFGSDYSHDSLSGSD